ncbi:MAG: SIS domain-containing protein, partial [Candidatus Woesearchaeota archaeon]|nr:SIS domain-containing protein [Candidatus Woesearchaeota archaeon]
GALTAGANDFGYEQVFSRQVEGLVNADDVVLGISTSGKSPNVLRALETAKKQHAITMAFTGKNGMQTPVDYCFAVPATETSVIQTGHLYAIHWICEHIDKKLALTEKV